MPKVILLSQIPLPYSKIGSWTTLYKNYLTSSHLVDAIVCPKPDYQFQNITYAIVRNDLKLKLQKRFLKKKYSEYFEALQKIIQPNEKYILQIIDNYGIVPHLEQHLLKKGIRNQFYIQFFYHGFPPFQENFQSRGFFEFIDEMVLLTHDSYKIHKEYYTVLPTKFSVLHNGIDTKKFFKVDAVQKMALKQKHNASDKKVFVWCSQDRPKKGLDLILDVWKRVYANDKSIELWVIGAKREQLQDGVRFLGPIQNDLLPEYLQASDVYLFPTLWHEGFGLSLIEALHCGNYCIASALGGVPEVLQYGKYGKLIENPHFIQDWVAAIQEYLEHEPTVKAIPADLYSTASWNSGMNTIINEAKLSFSK